MVVTHLRRRLGHTEVKRHVGTALGKAASRVQSDPPFRRRSLPRETRVLARGDRIQFRAPDQALGLANGEFATIRAIDARRAVLCLDNDKQLSVASDRLRHIDHGYVSTSHSAQGATVDRVIVDIDTLLSAELVNRKQFYVSISRARTSITIYTDNRGRLGHTINRSREKSMALQHYPTSPDRGFVVLPEQHQSISRGQGLRR